MQLLSDKKEHTNFEINERLGKFFNLSPAELNQLLPSGSTKVFSNRVAWAKAHLKMAGLVESTRRSASQITEAGYRFIATNPTEVSVRTLKSFSPYLDKTGKNKNDEPGSDNVVNVLELTPEELMESSYLTIRKNLAEELLSKIKTSSPVFFETLVVDLLVKMGYGGSVKDAGKSIGRSGDEGIDGIIKEDKLGLDVIYIQAKKWENVVGRPEIQKFVGALAGQGAKKGVFITTSKFSADAKAYQPKNETKIVLIDGDQLANLMIDYNLAVSTNSIFEIKRIDNDYFSE